MKKFTLNVVITIIVTTIAISCKKNENTDLEPTPVVNNSSIVTGIVLINEMVVKGSTNANEFGEFEDWFEIYNPQDLSLIHI